MTVILPLGAWWWPLSHPQPSCPLHCCLVWLRSLLPSAAKSPDRRNAASRYPTLRIPARSNGAGTNRPVDIGTIKLSITSPTEGLGPALHSSAAVLSAVQHQTSSFLQRLDSQSTFTHLHTRTCLPRATQNPTNFANLTHTLIPQYPVLSSSRVIR